MNNYDHKQIEKKWQNKWAEEALYKTEEDRTKPKHYVLDMFPYPSGEGLHVGHPKGYIATDVYSRMKTMQGYSVLHPMGWDAFGLPAEQFAIKNKVHPRVAVDKNTARYKEQLSVIGFNYDWEREINTTDPTFYKWTQWTFLKMFEKGLAFESYEPINWCPTCQTGLANEDLDNGLCERCDTKVEKRPMRQWVIRITDYADRLLEDLDALNWPNSIKESQRNWIGKSEGAEIDFEIDDSDKKITVFTTRPDTLFGATFVAISAELAMKWAGEGMVHSSEIKNYIHKTLAENANRSYEEKEKSGIFSGYYAINPANKEKIPVWIVNYVLGDVGTGAIMAVPAHDERDFDFAEKYNLPIHPVIEPSGEFWNSNIANFVNKSDEELKVEIVKQRENYKTGGICYTQISPKDELINSAQFSGLLIFEGQKAITEFVGGQMVKRYRLKDWVFSRQRYWGEPIPVIHCEKDGVVAVPEKELPVLLPDVESYTPTGTGESPLADIPEWVNVPCPKCGGPGKRETNTMPQWAGSSWYYLRYIDPKNANALVDKEKEKYWSPVDIYVGGAEHATRHLIYARFWHKFLFDIGVVNYEEPFKRLQNVGLIMAEDGRKMSKRWGNVINPDEVVKTYGADTLRLYEMFMGPFNQGVAWSTESIIGPRRFLERVWRLREKIGDGADGAVLDASIHKTIKKVSEDIESFGFNTAIAALMILVNEIERAPSISRGHFETLLQILAPFAPHMTEELWYELGNKESIHRAPWPQYDEAKIVENDVTIAIQVNGKLRDTMVVSKTLNSKELEAIVLTRPLIMKWVEGKTIKKVIDVPGKLLNIVISE
jgi:leucyl-tRNA synthetase